MRIKGLSKIICFIVLITGLLISQGQADEILFENQKTTKLGRILEIDEQSVTIRFPRESIQSVMMNREGALGKDEIHFKDQKDARIGTVLEVEEQSVTIRFPRESIQSIIMNREDASQPKELQESISLSDVELRERVKEIEKRLEGYEEDVQERKKSDSPITPNPSANATVRERLLQEEMGSVRGFILWRGTPLSNGGVKIVLEMYTGFSLASLKNMFRADKETSSQDEITLMTQTDSQGRYAFSKVPPGHYRIYWKSENETGWYHRFRDRPDFEVITGQMTVQNIPEHKE